LAERRNRLIVHTITKAQARRFVLRKQGLYGDNLFTGAEGVLRFIRQAGCVQYDPVDLCGKSHELTLLSRVSGITRAMLDDLLYSRRALIEYWDKNMSLISAEDWPCFARTRTAYADPGARSHDVVEEHAPGIRRYLREHGPSFSSAMGGAGKTDWYWSSTSIARAVLESLYFRGELCIHHRQGTHRCFDFANNCLPSELLLAADPHAADSEHREWQLERRIGAVGLVWNRASTAWLGIHDFKTQNRNAAFCTMKERNILSAVTITGLKDDFYLLTRDLPLLEESNGPSARPRTEIIAPLDSFMWDRKLISALFDFYYTWEIYTPENKLRYGHYVMPVLQGDAFAGRIQIRRDSRAKTLSAEKFWQEDGAKIDKGALERALGRLAVFLGLQDVHTADCLKSGLFT
jgi:uncharacterized protein